jgi:hypothetical protein
MIEYFYKIGVPLYMFFLCVIDFNSSFSAIHYVKNVGSNTQFKQVYHFPGLVKLTGECICMHERSWMVVGQGTWYGVDSHASAPVTHGRRTVVGAAVPSQKHPRQLGVMKAAGGLETRPSWTKLLLRYTTFPLAAKICLLIDCKSCHCSWWMVW